MKRAMRRGLEFHSASASSPCSSGTATSSACAILLAAPPILRLSSPPELNAASPSRAPLELVPCPLSFLLPLPPTATPPAALTWNPRRGCNKAAVAARGSSVTGTLAGESTTAPGRDGVRPGKDDDGRDVVVVDWQWPCGRGRRKIKEKSNKGRKWWRKSRRINERIEPASVAGRNRTRSSAAARRGACRSKLGGRQVQTRGRRGQGITVSAQAKADRWRCLSLPGVRGHHGGEPGRRFGKDRWTRARILPVPVRSPSRQEEGKARGRMRTAAGPNCRCRARVRSDAGRSRVQVQPSSAPQPEPAARSLPRMTTSQVGLVGACMLCFLYSCVASCTGLPSTVELLA